MNRLLITLLILISFSATAQKIEISRSDVDFGTISMSPQSEQKVIISNTGDKPLVIKSITVDCNCTTMQWKKSPIMPGRTTELKIIYAPDQKGVFYKKIRIISNAPSREIIVRGTAK